MSLCKTAFLSLYYHGSYPYRRWWNSRAAARGQAPVVVLFYHRVAETAVGDWTVSNRMFARQIRWLKARFDMISLEEAQRRIRSGANGRPSVSITFDDGYADNCQAALPLLIAEKIPCTYFVSTRHVTRAVPFEHDLALGHHFAPNTMDELRSLAAAGIEIGAHTRTHADLGRVADHRRLHDEVVTAGEELQNALGRPVRYFAFPFGQCGNLSPRAFHMAYDAGYEGVCSAYGGFNFPGDDAFHLQRFGVMNDMIHLKNWATIDPRKLSIPRYQYESRPVPKEKAPLESRL
ncbi:MAG: polysaccharide deacetylase family protein [Pirellulales bacterium]